MGVDMLSKICRFIRFILFLITAGVLNYSCHTNPTGPNLSIFYRNKILFTSSRSGNPQLYMMNPDGSNVVQITSGSSSGAQFGIWSPDANTIAFSSYNDSIFYEIPPIYVMTPSGLNRHLVGYGTPMSWSPNGSKIIIQAYGSPLYINDINTGKVEKTPLWGGLPDWSPDGNYIIYGYSVQNSNDSISSYEEVVTYPGFDSVRVVGPQTAGAYAWSPNGKYFVFDDLDHNLYIMNVDGSNIRKITNNNTSMAFANPRWSPNSNELIFLASTTDGSNKSYLYMTNIDGTNIHRVTDDSSVISADWSR